MRLIFRVVLFTLLAFCVSAVSHADHFTADCPLTFVDGTDAVSAFSGSPHGVFRNGSVVYLLRGQNLTTLETTVLGDLKVLREDSLDDMWNRDVNGATVYHNGYLYVSGDAGLEVFDLRSVSGTGNGPSFLARFPGLHYREMAASGNVLAAVYSANDLPCAPLGNSACTNAVDIFSITDPANPVRVGRINAGTTFRGFNDVAFAAGLLWTTGLGGTHSFNLTNPSLPSLTSVNATRGDFLATNGTDLLAVGQETLIGMFTVRPTGLISFFSVFTLPSIMSRSNSLMFHPEAWVADSRLITMIDEKDPQTARPGRTIAFDVFDFTVPFYEGFDDRIYENVSFTQTNERLYNPIAIGPYVYVIGEVSGTQKWGACGEMAGRIELDSVRSLSCGGAEIHGWVTGASRVVNVEVFLGADFLGNATFGSPRTDIVSSNEVVTWRIPVNLDSTVRGSRTLRVIGTDAAGSRFQFASADIFFPGPGQNCTARRRVLKRP